uniref:Pentapeptide repeat-containing protein n=1 Tax=Angiostrongylus cantonensis TaxID=6313 RepID=A0A0K0D8C7_ANGCA
MIWNLFYEDCTLVEHKEIIAHSFVSDNTFKFDGTDFFEFSTYVFMHQDVNMRNCSVEDGMELNKDNAAFSLYNAG